MLMRKNVKLLTGISVLAVLVIVSAVATLAGVLISNDVFDEDNKTDSENRCHGQQGKKHAPEKSGPGPGGKRWFGRIIHGLP